jgi:uncharacterized coiled-coil protein SlyX
MEVADILKVAIGFCIGLIAPLITFLGFRSKINAERKEEWDGYFDSQKTAMTEALSKAITEAVSQSGQHEQHRNRLNGLETRQSYHEKIIEEVRGLVGELHEDFRESQKETKKMFANFLDELKKR